MTSGSFPVPSESVEAGLLHACTTMSLWLELSIFTEDDFTSHRDIYRFFKSHLSQYGNLPSQSQLSTRFNWQPPIGEFHYWFAEMKRYSLARKVLQAVQDGYSEISNPDKALGTLLNKLSIIRSEQSNHVKATDASAMERLDRFDARTENLFNSNKLLGIPTGMKIYDDSLIGWMPGSLIGCYGRPGIGKTWWLLWQGIQAWMAGYTVLAITPEMPSNLLNLRIDCMVGQAIGKPIEYNKLLRGDPSIREEYEFIVAMLAQSARWWTYDSMEDHSVGLGDISALIHQHKADIVLIDGISLLHSDNRGPAWEQMKDICYGMKNLATISEVPIIMTHQAVNFARGHTTEITAVGRGDSFNMPSLNDAAYGDSFVRACSDVITMCAEKISKHINWYSIRKSRERGWANDLDSRYGFAIDFAVGKMVDLSEYGYNPARVGQETQRVLGHL